MVQILQKPLSLTEALGAGLGTGLGSGLQQLAQLKLQELQQQQALQKAATGLMAAGLSPQESLMLSQANPLVQQEVVKQRLAAPQQEAYGRAINQLLGFEQPQETLTERLSSRPQPSFEVSERLPKSTQSQLQNLTPSQLMELINAGAIGGGVEQAQIPRTVKPLSADRVKAHLSGELNTIIGSSLTPATFTERQATELARLSLQKQKMSAQERREAFKITKDERTALRDKSRQAKQDLKDLNRLEELDETGKLDSPALNEFLTRSGLDIPALRSPESEEFQKISANFLRNAKNYFGARVSNFEIEQFLKTIPSLSQSPEGRKRVIANLKHISQAANAYYDTMREVIADNNGIPPLDLSEKIDDRIDRKLDRLSDEFKRNVLKPVPQQKLIHKIGTGISAGLGSLVGAPGSLLGKAGKAFSMTEIL